MSKTRRFFIYLALAVIPAAFFQVAIILDNVTATAGKFGLTGLLWAVFIFFGGLVTYG